jgi:hypothetical protein
MADSEQLQIAMASVSASVREDCVNTWLFCWCVLSTRTKHTRHLLDKNVFITAVEKKK